MTADKIAELSKALNLSDEMFREYIMALHNENKLERLKRYLSEDMYLILSGAVKSCAEKQYREVKSDVNCTESKENFVHNRRVCASNTDNYQKVHANNTQLHKAKLTPSPKYVQTKFGIRSGQKREEYTFRLTRGETIDTIKELVLSLTGSHDVVCIRGDTGCGKSTLIPQFLLERFHTVVCTQPRRLAAISIAKYVKRTLGGEVGYKVRFEEDISDKTRLVYVTDGILLRNNLRSDMLVVDEAHERTVNIDVLLAMKRRMVVMSATLSEDIVDFFKCPLINIEVERFPVEVFYLRSEADNYLKETIETTEMLCSGSEYRKVVANRPRGGRLAVESSKEIVTGNSYENDMKDSGIRTYASCKTGDVLVFLPGMEEISHAYRSLKRSLSSSHMIIPLHSSSQSPHVFAPSAQPKIILATNIAETSITLDVDYVIDSGYFKQKTFMQIDTLFVARISRSQARQRAGRVGRVREGTVYRIYTKKEFETFPECIDPEILRVNLCNVVLLLTSLRVCHTNMVTSLPEDRLEEAQSFLESIGALRNRALTVEGKKMSTLPVHVQCAKTLLVASRLGVLVDTATIISMLSVPNIIKGEFTGFRSDTDINVLRKYENAQGDHYTLLNIYRRWEDEQYSHKFLEANGMNIKNMQHVKKVRDQLIEHFLLDRARTHTNSGGRAGSYIDADTEDCYFYKRSCSNSQNDDNRLRHNEHHDSYINQNGILQAFLEGFKHNVARKRGDTYITVTEGKICYIHPSSVLHGRTPEYVLFNDLVMTKKEYMRWCMALDSKDFSPNAHKFM